MNNKYYLATVLLALGGVAPLYGVQNTRPRTPPFFGGKKPPPPPPIIIL